MAAFGATSTTASESSENATDSWWFIIQPGTTSATTATAAAALDDNNNTTSSDAADAGFSAAKASPRVRELAIPDTPMPSPSSTPTPRLRYTMASTSTAAPEPQDNVAAESEGGGSGGGDESEVATVILGTAAVASGVLLLLLAYGYRRKRRKNRQGENKEARVTEEDTTAPATGESPQPQTPDASRMPVTADAPAHGGALSRSVAKSGNSLPRPHKPDLDHVEEIKDENNEDIAAPPENEATAASSEVVRPAATVVAHEAGRETTAMEGSMASSIRAVTSSEVASWATARRGDDRPNSQDSGRGGKGVSVLASPENYGMFPQPFSDVRVPVHPYSPLPAATTLLGVGPRGIQARDGEGNGNGNGNGNRHVLAGSDLPGNHNGDGVRELAEVGGAPQVDVADLVLDNNDYYDRVVDESGTLREAAAVVAEAAAAAAAAAADGDAAMMTREGRIGGISGGEGKEAAAAIADPSALPEDEKLAASAVRQEPAPGNDRKDATAATAGAGVRASVIAAAAAGRAPKLAEEFRPSPGSGRGRDYRRSRSAAFDSHYVLKNRGETPHTSTTSSSSSSSSSGLNPSPSPSPAALWGGAREWQRQRPEQAQRLRPLALRSRLLRRASSMFSSDEGGLSLPLQALAEERARPNDTAYGSARSDVELAPAMKDGRAASRPHSTLLWDQRGFSRYENVSGGVGAGLRAPPRRSVSMAPRMTFSEDNGGRDLSAGAVAGGGGKRMLPPRPSVEDRRVTVGATLPPLWSKLSSSSSSSFSLLPGLSRVGIRSALGCGGGGDGCSSGQPTPVRRGADGPMTFDVGAMPSEKIGWWGKRSRRVWAASDGTDGGEGCVGRGVGEGRGYTSSPFFVCGEVVATPPRPPRELAPREIHDETISKRVRGGRGGGEREEKEEKDTRFKDTGMSASPAMAATDTE